MREKPSIGIQVCGKAPARIRAEFEREKLVKSGRISRVLKDLISTLKNSSSYEVTQSGKLVLHIIQFGNELNCDSTIGEQKLYHSGGKESIEVVAKYLDKWKIRYVKEAIVNKSGNNCSKKEDKLREKHTSFSGPTGEDRVKKQEEKELSCSEERKPSKVKAWGKHMFEKL